MGTSLVVIGLSSSIYHFVFVNMDRLIALKLPLNYKANNSETKIKLGIAACWCLSLLPALPMWVTSSSSPWLGQTCSFPYNNVRITSALLFLGGNMR